MVSLSVVIELTVYEKYTKIKERKEGMSTAV